MYRFAIIAGIIEKRTSSCFFLFFFNPSLFLFLDYLSLNSLYFQHLHPNPLWVFNSLSFLLHAHTLSLCLSPSLAFRPPRQPSLCAPAVPLLWLEFVLLCFGMATIEAAPTATHPTPFLSPLAPFFPALSAHALKESQREWLLCLVQVSRVGEKGRRGCCCLLSEGEVIQPGIPHLWQVLTHMSQPVTAGL